MALLLPLVGLTLSQLALSEADQLTLELILKVVDPASLPTERLDGLTVSEDESPACVTVTCRVMPPPVMVIVAVLELVPLLLE